MIRKEKNTKYFYSGFNYMCFERAVYDDALPVQYWPNHNSIRP